MTMAGKPFFGKKQKEVLQKAENTGNFSVNFIIYCHGNGRGCYAAVGGGK
jgi:hypothetical protein